MNSARRAFGIFLAIQACALVIVGFVLDGSSLFRAVLPAQAALFGIVLSVGPIQHVARILGAIIVGALFVVVVTTLALQLDIGGLFGRHGYGWQFLMMMVRVLLIGGFYWRCLLRQGVVLSTSGEPWGGALFRFRLLHLLVLMSLVALYFGVMRSLSGGPFYALVLVLYVVLLGCAYTIMSLFASLLALDPHYTPGKVIACLCGILLFSLAIAGHAYEAQSGWNSAKFAWMEAMIEVAWIVGSLVALRRSGFRLVKKVVRGKNESPSEANSD
jgi:hypothetical protein